jgi:hypothetical protein
LKQKTTKTNKRTNPYAKGFSQVLTIKPIMDSYTKAMINRKELITREEWEPGAMEAGMKTTEGVLINFWKEGALGIKEYQRYKIAMEMTINVFMEKEDEVMEDCTDMEYMTTIDVYMYWKKVVIPYITLQQEMVRTIKTPKTHFVCNMIDLLTLKLDALPHMLNDYTLPYERYRLWKEAKKSIDKETGGDIPIQVMIFEDPLKDQDKKHLKHAQQLIEQISHELGLKL